MGKPTNRGLRQDRAAVRATSLDNPIARAGPHRFLVGPTDGDGMGTTYGRRQRRDPYGVPSNIPIPMPLLRAWGGIRTVAAPLSPRHGNMPRVLLQPTAERSRVVSPPRGSTWTTILLGCRLTPLPFPCTEVQEKVGGIGTEPTDFRTRPFGELPTEFSICTPETARTQGRGPQITLGILPNLASMWVSTCDPGR